MLPVSVTTSLMCDAMTVSYPTLRPLRWRTALALSSTSKCEGGTHNPG